MGDEHEIPRPAGPCMHAGAMMRPALPRRARRRRHDHAAVPPPLARGATSGAASFRTPDIASRPSPSPPRAFVIAFVRRHSAPPWRIGRRAGERERTEEATHASIDRIGFRARFRLPLHLQFCMARHAPLGHVRVMQRDGDAPEPSARLPVPERGPAEAKRPARTHHGVAPPHSLCPCLGLLPVPARRPADAVLQCREYLCSAYASSRKIKRSGRSLAVSSLHTVVPFRPSVLSFAKMESVRSQIKSD